MRRPAIAWPLLLADFGAAQGTESLEAIRRALVVLGERAPRAAGPRRALALAQLRRFERGPDEREAEGSGAVLGGRPLRVSAARLHDAGAGWIDIASTATTPKCCR